MNASMPFVVGDYGNIRRTLQLQIYDYGLIWVQHIDYIGRCTALGFNRIHTDLECASRNAFICEMGDYWICLLTIKTKKYNMCTFYLLVIRSSSGYKSIAMA